MRLKNRNGELEKRGYRDYMILMGSVNFGFLNARLPFDKLKVTKRDGVMLSLRSMVGGKLFYTLINNLNIRKAKSDL